MGTSKSYEEVQKAEFLYDSEQAYKRLVLQGQLNDKKRYLVQEITNNEGQSVEAVESNDLLETSTPANIQGKTEGIEIPETSIDEQSTLLKESEETTAPISNDTLTPLQESPETSLVTENILEIENELYPGVTHIAQEANCIQGDNHCSLSQPIEFILTQDSPVDIEYKILTSPITSGKLHVHSNGKEISIITLTENINLDNFQKASLGTLERGIHKITLSIESNIPIASYKGVFKFTASTSQIPENKLSHNNHIPQGKTINNDSEFDLSILSKSINIDEKVESIQPINSNPNELALIGENKVSLYSLTENNYEKTYSHEIRDKNDYIDLNTGTIVINGGFIKKSTSNDYTYIGNESVNNLNSKTIAGDFNNDEILDLASFSSQGGLNVYFGNVDGGYALQHSSIQLFNNLEGISPDLATDVKPIEIADLNNDGFSDIVIVLILNNRKLCSILYGNGNGDFVRRFIDIDGENTSFVNLADYEDDKDVDLLISTETENNINYYLLENQGTLDIYNNFNLTKLGEHEKDKILGGILEINGELFRIIYTRDSQAIDIYDINGIRKIKQIQTELPIKYIRVEKDKVYLVLTNKESPQLNLNARVDSSESSEEASSQDPTTLATEEQQSIVSVISINEVTDSATPAPPPPTPETTNNQAIVRNLHGLGPNFPEVQESVTTRSNGVLDSVNRILKSALLENPNSIFNNRVSGALAGLNGERWINTPHGILTQFDITRNNINLNGPLLTNNYFFHILNNHGIYEEVVKIDNIYNIFPNEKITIDPIPNGNNDIGQGIINDPALRFVYEERGTQPTEVSYTENTGEILTLNQSAFFKSGTEYARFDSEIQQTFNIINVVTAIHDVFKLAVNGLNPLESLVRIPNDISLSGWRILNTEKNGVETAYFLKKYLLAREIKDLFSNRIPLNIRKIIFIPKEQHPDPKPPADTLLYEIEDETLKASNVPNPIRYCTVENGISGVSNINVLVLSNGFLYNNDIAYNEPSTQIELSRKIKDIQDKLFPENKNLQIPIDTKVKLVQLLIERENFLQSNLLLLNHAALTPHQKAYEYLLNKKKESIINTINQYRGDIQAYITSQTAIANQISNPLEKYIALLKLKKLEQAISTNPETIEDQVNYLQDKVNNYIEIVNKYEIATRDVAQAISTIKSLLSTYELDLLPKLRKSEDIVYPPQPRRPVGYSTNELALAMEMPILLAAAPVEPNFGVDEFYYGLTNYIRQLQVKVDQLNSFISDSQNDPYYINRARELLPDLIAAQVKANELRVEATTIEIPMLRTLISELAPSITATDANILAERMVRRYNSHTIRKIFARVHLLNKLKFLSETNRSSIGNTDLVRELYGVDFGFTTSTAASITAYKMNIEDLINWLGRERGNYRLERKYIVLFGAIEELLYQRINSVLQDINLKATRIKESQDRNIVSFDNLLRESSGRYEFWNDVRSAFLLGNEINGEQAVKILAVKNASREITNLEDQIKTLAGKITCFDLAGLEYEAYLQRFYGKKEFSDFINIGAWLKYKSQIQIIDPQLFNELANIVRRYFPDDTGDTSYPAELLRQHLDSSRENDRIHGPINQPMHPLRSLVTIEGYYFGPNSQPSPGMRFFTTVDEKFNEIKKFRPSIALPLSIFKDNQYYCGNRIYRPALYALTYSFEYQKFSDAFIKLQKSLVLFAAVSQLASGNGQQIYRGDDFTTYATEIKNSVKQNLDEAKIAAQPIISWLGTRYENTIGTIQEQISPASTRAGGVLDDPVTIPAVNRARTQGIFPDDFFSGALIIRPGNVYEEGVNVSGQSNRYRDYTINLDGEIGREGGSGETTIVVRRVADSAEDSVENVKKLLPKLLKQPIAKIIFSMKCLNDTSAGSLEHVINNINFSSTTWYNFLTRDLIIAIAAIICAIAAIAFFLPSGGSSSIFATSALGALGGLIGAQIAMEVLYIAHISSGGDPALTGGQSRLGRWARSLAQHYPGLYTAIETFASDVAAAYLYDFAVNFLTTFVTVGVGSQIVNFIGPRLPNVIMRGRVSATPQNQTGLETIKYVASRNTRIGNFLREFFEELREELAYEAFLERTLPVFSEHGPGLLVVVAGGLVKKRAANIQSTRNVYEYDPQSRTALRTTLEGIGYTITDTNNTNFIATRQLPPGVTINGRTQTDIVFEQGADTSQASPPTTQIPNIRQMREQLLGIVGTQVTSDRIYFPVGEHKLPSGLTIIVKSVDAVDMPHLNGILNYLNKLPEHVQRVIFPFTRITVGEPSRPHSDIPNGSPAGLYNSYRDIEIFENGNNLKVYIHELGHLLHHVLNDYNDLNSTAGRVNTDQTLVSLHRQAIRGYDSNAYDFRMSEYIADLFVVWVNHVISEDAPNFNIGRFLRRTYTQEQSQALEQMYNHLVEHYFTNESLMNEQANKFQQYENAIKNTFNLEFAQIFTSESTANQIILARAQFIEHAKNYSSEPAIQRYLEDFANRLIMSHINATSPTNISSVPISTTSNASPGNAQIDPNINLNNDQNQSNTVIVNNMPQK